MSLQTDRRDLRPAASPCTVQVDLAFGVSPCWCLSVSVFERA